MVLWVLSLALVGDLGVESVVVVGDVLDGLDTAVGQSHLVVAGGLFAVTVLVRSEVSARIVVVDGVVEGVRLGLLFVLRLRVVGGRLVGRGRAVSRLAVRSWGTGGNSQDGGNDEYLEQRGYQVIP